MASENMEEYNVGSLTHMNKKNVWFKSKGAEWKNGQNGVQLFVQKELDNILKLEKGLSLMKGPSSPDTTARRKRKMLRQDCAKDALLGGTMSLMEMSITVTES